MAALPEDKLGQDVSAARSTPSAAESTHADDPTANLSAGHPPPPSPVPAGLPLGASIEGYVLTDELHRGGQGVVYRALQLGTKRQVALKVLLEGPFAGENARRRFEREVELAASLRHPNIVVILDSGLSRGRYYFAMEYIDGLRLDRYVAQKRPTLAEALRLFEKVCDAVNFANQRGVIHRDLKPPNILVDSEGEPHILDFGLAKPVHHLAATDSTVQELSTSGQLVGTVAYMSPEQAAGAQDVDVRTDVYSLGVIFYEALTGHHPYVVDGPLGEVLSRIARDEPDNPRSVPGQLRDHGAIDDELATILLKTLEKEPARRYQTAGELGHDLRRRRLGEPIEAKRASGLYMLKKLLRRYRLHAATAALILVMLLGFLVTFAILFSSERAARRVAVEKSAEARQAVTMQQDALHEARARAREATQAQQDLRRALIREQIQRGDLALARGDVREARDSFWQALDVGPSPAAIWALRRYYLQTFDSNSTLLGFEPFAGRGAERRACLSPNGQWAAVCGTHDSILLRQLPPGTSSSWVRTPGPVTLLNVTDDGALAAAGQDWARCWPAGATCPAVAAQRNELRRPSAVYPAVGGQALLLVEDRAVVLLTGSAGEQIRRAPFKGARAGPPDFAPRSDRLAIPTTAGVDLVSIAPDGALHSDLIWTGPQPARAVHFDENGRLAILADAVYVDTARNAEAPQWQRAIDAPPEWELFDARDDGATIALGARDGSLAIYRNGQRQALWRCTADRLEQLGLSAEDGCVVTLDDRGAVTRWAALEHTEQRRQVLDAAPVTWAASDNGATVVLAVARGQVLAYSYEPGATFVDAARPPTRTILRPRLLDPRADQLTLALDADGGRAVIRDRTTVRLVRLSDLATRPMPWRQDPFFTLDKVALRSDGGLVALLVANQRGDRQRVLVRPWNLPEETSDHPSPADPPEPGLAVEFVGAVVRDVAFIPQTSRLLVVRSNGQLMVIDADSPNASAEPWLKLDASPTAIAFSRTGAYLAAAGEDHVLRLISVGGHEVRERIPINDRVSALAFNPRDDILLVRTSDGTVRLIDPATGEIIAAWPLLADTDEPLAVWVGDDADAMLLGQGQGVYEYRYASSDALIERNRPYAFEQQVARSLADADFPAAWEAAGRLEQLEIQRGHWARLAVLEAALQRPTVEVPGPWVQAALQDGTSADYARLGNAAYDGERFDLAREWLGRSVALASSGTDAFTRWRLAGCDYLAGAYDEAEAELARSLDQPDFDPAQAPTAVLQRVAALWLAGRASEARAATMHIGEPNARGLRGDPVAATYASAIARVMTGLEADDSKASVVDGLVGNVGVLFQEDEHFFAGELARQRGDNHDAALRYQRCIDLARDEWPANWARYRLSQLAPAATP